MTGSDTRFDRQQGLVPRGALTMLTVTIIGVGAVGRQVALQLAALGATRLQLIDFDRVVPTNITTQGFLQVDLDLAKVTATARACRQIEPAIVVETIEDRFRPQHQLGDVVFCCVDSISARAAIWRASGHRSRFWCDGRMLGEVIRVLTVADDQGRGHYPTTLFEQSQAQTGACTALGVIYTATMTAGLMLHQFCRWLRSQPIDRDLSLNLLASELVAN